jgi:maltose transport system substrate-binding protein
MILSSSLRSTRLQITKSLLSYAANKDLYNVAWDFAVFPGQTFKNNFGAALLEYAQGKMQWPDVKQLFIDQWKIEAAKIQ